MTTVAAPSKNRQRVDISNILKNEIDGVISVDVQHHNERLLVKCENSDTAAEVLGRVLGFKTDLLIYDKYEVENDRIVCYFDYDKF